MLASLDLNKERIQRKANVASRYNVYQLADAGQSCASMGKVARYMWPVRLAITIIITIIMVTIIILHHCHNHHHYHHGHHRHYHHHYHHHIGFSCQKKSYKIDALRS